jgi:hypothetical protein
MSTTNDTDLRTPAAPAAEEGPERTPGEHPEEEEILLGDEEATAPDSRAARGVFTSPTPYRDEKADCLVISCSDRRFRLHTIRLVKHLGFSRPEMIQIPGGIAVSLPLLAAFGFLSKAVDRILEKAVESTGVNEVICIAHEDCGGYRAENVKFLDTAVRRVTGDSVRDTQIGHLRKAARRLQMGLRQVTVRAFFADVQGEGGEAQVIFEEIPLDRR